MCNEATHHTHWSSQITQMAQNAAAMRETWVQSLGWKGPLEKGKGARSSALAWRTHGQRSLAGYSPRGHREPDTAERLSAAHTPIICQINDSDRLQGSKEGNENRNGKTGNLEFIYNVYSLYNKNRKYGGTTSSQMALVVKNLSANAGDMRWGFEPLEEGMATHCSILAWRIPWTEEPGGLQSMGSQRVRYDWSDLARMHVRMLDNQEL